MEILRDWKINLTADHVLRAQGSNPGIIKDRKPRVYEIADWAVTEGLPLLDPTVLQEHYFVHKLRHQKLELVTNNKELKLYLSGSLIAQHLATAEEVIIMLCTIGDALEKIAANLMKTDPLYGWALDSFGSASVEFLATQACSRVETLAQVESKQSSIPLSPGMVGWILEKGQSEIFNLIDASQINVHLNNNYQMQPSKTISVAIGIGRFIMPFGNTCDYCSMNTTCRYQNHYD